MGEVSPVLQVYVSGPREKRPRSAKCAGTCDARTSQRPITVPSPREKCGPGTERPRTGDRKAADPRRNGCGPGTQLSLTGDGGAGNETLHHIPLLVIAFLIVVNEPDQRLQAGVRERHTTRTDRGAEAAKALKLNLIALAAAGGGQALLNVGRDKEG